MTRLLVSLAVPLAVPPAVLTLAVAIPPAAWPAALLVGLSLGMLGSGGSILTVPLLHSVVGLPFAEAKSTSLAIVGLVALAGLVGHARRGAVRASESIPFVAASVPMSYVASRYVAPLVPATVQTIAFVALMAIAAWRMAFAPPPSDARRASKQLPVVLALAALAGTLTGLLGVGGGFVIVPALVLTLGFDVRHAVGTSLLVIALNCAAGLAAKALGGGWGEVRLDLVGLFTLAGVVGALVGGRLAHRLPAYVLRRVFAAVITVMAVVMLVRL